MSGVTNQDSARTASEYDAMAVEYDRHNASGAANSYYERPATIALLGDVTRQAGFGGRLRHRAAN